MSDNNRAVRAFVDEIVAEERQNPPLRRKPDYEAVSARWANDRRPRQEPGAWVVYHLDDGVKVLGIYGSELEALRWAVNGPYTGAKVTRVPWGPIDLEKTLTRP